MFDYTTRLGLLASCHASSGWPSVFVLLRPFFSLYVLRELHARGDSMAYLAVPLHQNRHWQ